MTRADTEANRANVRLVHSEEVPIFDVSFLVHALLVHADASVAESVLANSGCSYHRRCKAAGFIGLWLLYYTFWVADSQTDVFFVFGNLSLALMAGKARECL